jgi:hypothetical protein
MISAWKFLDERSRGLFSGFAWPTPRVAGEPGPWVDAGDAVACERGVHACTADDLSWWMSAQLWEIELDGAIRVGERKIVGERGRLARMSAVWPTLAGDLAAWAVWRVRDNTVELLQTAGETATAELLRTAKDADDVVAAIGDRGCDPKSPVGIAIAQVVDAVGDLGNPIVACHDAARSAGHLASSVDRSIHTFNTAFAAERLAQSEWIAALI